MSNTPTIKATLDQPDYAAGDPVTATATVTDADTRVETLDTTGSADGVDVEVVETRTYTDRATISWKLDGADLVSGGHVVTFPAPDRDAKLTASVVDGQGHTAADTVAVVVRQPATTMRIGFVSPPRATAGNPYGWAEHFKALPKDRTQMIAAYNEPGTKVDAWSSLPTIPDGTDVHIRIKDPLAAPWFPEFLATTPKAVRNLLVTHRHEYKGPNVAGKAPVDEELSVYVDAYRYGRAAIDDAGMTGRALLTPYYMSYQVEHGQDFAKVWPTGPKGDPICDLIAFSCYSNESLDGYRTPQDLFKAAVDWANRANVQLVIAEWGMQIDSGKPGQTDAKRAEMIRETLPYLRSLKLADGRPLLYSVTWWSSLSTNTGDGGKRNDFRLLLDGAKASLKAYATA